MSIRVSGRALRSTLAIAALIAGAAVLSGCTTLGSRALGSPQTTGSVSSSAASNFNQPMPQALAGGQSVSRFVPPANIDGAGPVFGGGSQMAAAGQVSTVTSQDLPVLTPSLGSPPAMSAQPMPQLAALQQPMPAAAPAQPRLSVVASNSAYHTIESGESLYSIARRYNVTTQDIIAANGFNSPDKIFVGQRIAIPGRPDLVPQQPMPVQVAMVEDQATTGAVPTAPMPAPNNAAALPSPNLLAVPERTTAVQTQAPSAARATTALAEPAVSGADKFRWPVSGRVITDFASSKKTGINIEAAEGAAVRAAENGSVIYTGSDVQGYGNLVLIRHANGYVSAYAHLKDMSVNKGDTVQRGDTIGTAGMTGSVSRPQVHFELRKGATPVDPMPLLAG